MGLVKNVEKENIEKDNVERKKTRKEKIKKKFGKGNVESKRLKIETSNNFKDPSKEYMEFHTINST
jgi:hypothetical protein